MSPGKPTPPLRSESALKALIWPKRLTLAGLWAERLTRAFWPLWVVILLAFAATAFGLHDLGSMRVVRIAIGATALAALVAAGLGLKAFQRPTQAQALQRLDASLKGRPIAALQDAQALGAEDPASAAVWQAHIARMSEAAAQAKPVQPDLQLSSRDPYALRYVALTAAVMAAIFGSFWRASEVIGISAGPAGATPALGPTWEAWARPPAYTGKPTVYLNDFIGDHLELPVGSRIQIRLYDAKDGASIEQDIAQSAAPPDPKDALPEGLSGLHDLTLSQSGHLTLTGSAGREWFIEAIADETPQVALTGVIGREADGRFRQDWQASDDYGITSGEVRISLDLPEVRREFGLEIAPEAHDPVTLDLALPMRGAKDTIKDTLVDDLSKSVLSNLPVTMEISVTDAAAQTGYSLPQQIILPGRRFFDPMAAAVIEMRRDLLWNRANAPRVSQILKALIHRPDHLPRSKNAARKTRVMLREMDKALTNGTLSTPERDQFAEDLWTIAFMFEEGDLGSAWDRLQRAQDRLEEAIRNGASPEEVDQLMKEMQQAMREYTRELAEDSARNPNSPPPEDGEKITGDQLQQMMDEIQRLMNEGKTAEAMALMEQLRQLMENLQVQQGQGGEGGESQGPLQDLGKTLRDQQGLSDDAYRDMQRGYNPDQGAPQTDPQDFADRQKELRQQLGDMQQRQMPGDGTEKGEVGRQALDRAEDAMREAEEALREGDLSSALDRQAEAMREMRDGMREFSQAQNRDRRENGQTGREGQERSQNGARSDMTDPLGREQGNSGRLGSDGNMAENSPDQRARDLLEELRRRSGEADRPDTEREYLKRLLDLF